MSAGGPGSDDKVSILLVDDRPDKLIVLEAILAELEQNLVKAQSGKEALKHVLNQDFAVILLDVNMPGMDGFETATLIRQRQSSETTPIIFFTAHDEEKYVSRSYSLGAVDYIRTPVDPDILRAKVQVFVDRYKNTARMRRQAEERRQGQEQSYEKRLRDVAARPEAEPRLDRFFSLASDMLGILGFDGFFKHLNPSWHETLGFTDEELKARPLLEIIHEEDRPATAAHLERARQGAPVVSLRQPVRVQGRGEPMAGLDGLRVPAGGPALHVRPRHHVAEARGGGARAARARAARPHLRRVLGAPGRVPGRGEHRPGRVPRIPRHPGPGGPHGRTLPRRRLHRGHRGGGRGRDAAGGGPGRPRQARGGGAAQERRARARLRRARGQSAALGRAHHHPRGAGRRPGGDRAGRRAPPGPGGPGAAVLHGGPHHRPRPEPRGPHLHRRRVGADASGGRTSAWPRTWRAGPRWRWRTRGSTRPRRRLGRPRRPPTAPRTSSWPPSPTSCARPCPPSWAGSGSSARGTWTGPPPPAAWRSSSATCAPRPSSSRTCSTSRASSRASCASRSGRWTWWRWWRRGSRRSGPPPTPRASASSRAWTPWPRPWWATPTGCSRWSGTWCRTR